MAWIADTSEDRFRAGELITITSGHGDLCGGPGHWKGVGMHDLFSTVVLRAVHVYVYAVWTGSR
jgi:hypothetical protein